MHPRECDSRRVKKEDLLQYGSVGPPALNGDRTHVSTRSERRENEAARHVEVIDSLDLQIPASSERAKEGMIYFDTGELNPHPR